MSRIEILYVDDDDDIRTIVELSLGMDPDIRLETFASALPALERLKSWSPDAVLLDVMMPDMDGPTLLALFRQQSADTDTPVIFMTAKGRDADISYYRALGAVGVILKPFDPLHLAREIRTILNRPR